MIDFNSDASVPSGGVKPVLSSGPNLVDLTMNSVESTNLSNNLINLDLNFAPKLSNVTLEDLVADY